MTAPTITYGKGWVTDCDDDTDWVEAVSGMTAGQANMEVVNDDVFKITGVCDSSGDEWCSYMKDISALAVNTTTYNKFIVRYKTSVASSGLGCRVRAYYTTASGGGYTDMVGPTPAFSTSWVTASGTLTAGRVIEYIIIYADDYLDAVTGGTFYVYVDFILIYKGLFTFPFVSGEVTLEMLNQYADLVGLERVGDITQWIATDNPEIKVTGETDASTSWGSPDGQYLYQIMLDAFNDPWQWFTSDVITCKVTPRRFKVSQSGGKTEAPREFEFEAKMYSRGSGGDRSMYPNLEWIGK